jgi:alpha-mannosidase
LRIAQALVLAVFPVVVSTAAPAAPATPNGPAAQVPVSEGLIREWLVLGAFPRDDAATRLAAPALSDEAAAAPRPGETAEGLIWTLLAAPSGTVDLASPAAGFAYRHNAVAYAFVHLLSPEACDARLRIGTTGGVAAWVNGDEAWRLETARPMVPDEDIVPIRLCPGWNLLLLKLSQGTGPWTFVARVTDAAGQPVAGLQSAAQTSAVKPPPAPRPHTVEALGAAPGPLVVEPDGTVRAEVRVRIRNLSPDPSEGAAVALASGPQQPMEGAPRPETGPLPPWGMKTLSVLLPLPDFLAFAGSSRPGVEVTAKGATSFAAADEDLAVRALRSVVGPIRIRAWRVVNRNASGAEQVFFDDAALVPAEPGSEMVPAEAALWLRARLSVPGPLEGAPLALCGGRAGLRTEVFVNGASLGEAKGEPLPLPPGPRDYVIALKVEPSGTRAMPLPAAEILLADEAALFAHRNLGPVAELFPALRPALRQEGTAALASLGTKAGGGYRDFAAALGTLNARLRQQARGLKDFTVWFVGQSHIDLAWLWRRDEAARLVQDAFGQALQLSAEFPRFTYAQDQAAVYAVAERHAPDLLAKVRQAVQSRRWSVTGGMWVEPDLCLPSGESIARQLLHGQRWLRERLGTEASTGWLPGAPGHAAQVPQLLRKAGIDACHLRRGAGGRTLFWWEGLDGSRILVHAAPPRTPSPDLVREVPAARRQSAVLMQLYGTDAPGGGPSREDLRRIDDLRAREVFPTADCGTPEAFFARAASTAKEVPVVSGELLDAAAGAWTTRGVLKQANRRGESLLADAESAAAVAHDLGLPADRASLQRAWRLLLVNQAHPLLGGASIREAAADAERDHAELAAAGDQVLRTALETIAARVRTEGDGIPVVVFNPLPWARTDAAEADLVYDGALRSLAVFDDAGAETPAQPLLARPGGPVRVLFLARDVPALGIRVFRVRDAGAKKQAFPAVEAAADGTRLRTDRWRLEIDAASGCLRLADAKHGRDAVVASPALLARGSVDTPPPPGGNLLQLFGDRGADSARTITYTGERWNLDRGAKVRLLETGPVRAVVRIVRTFKDERPDYTFGGVTTVQQDLVVYRDLDRIELRHEADWQERYKILKLAFPAAVTAETAAAEVPYGVVARPAAGGDYPAQTWVDLSDGTYGLAMLNDGRAGYDVTGSVLRAHLIRSAFDADPETDRGRHRFTIGLLPHAGDWRTAALPRRGREMNRPLSAWATRPHAGRLEPALSFLAVEPENVVADAVKQAEDSDALVVRLAEMHGAKGTTARIRLWREPAKAVVTDLLERGGEALPVSGRTLDVPIGPFEIKTVRIELAEPK